ncbi:hypothetical protein CPAR01_16462 [Colletotrichum paranaense]|uniref:Uncharacterized protein n=2 Tax=Colletotrichum acutatum species complex TaxID=2707335 RepID=A0AAI9YPQ3_9PEZI|nr:uncharacterized protein CCOS01_11795 [Colletotrichum costaricense]XP_060340620.1 uncharacterized protein CPAR01_16462 [Colletotrichum paranaense]KAK1516143.1 hypothetical protein CPAR01_16462 [Colletotrichum paranaense]KAK1518975.1 hypothetical protein CCOS01_11795 [Colletotrichum costaricense]
MKPRHMNGTASQRAGRLSVFLGIVSVPSIKFHYHLSHASHPHTRTEKVSCTFGFTAFQAAPVERASWPGVPNYPSGTPYTHTRPPAASLPKFPLVQQCTGVLSELLA